MSGGFSLREAMLSLEKRGDQTEVILHPNIIIVPYVQSTILVNDQYKYVKITYKKKNQSSVIKHRKNCECCPVSQLIVR